MNFSEVPELNDKPKIIIINIIGTNNENFIFADTFLMYK